MEDSSQQPSENQPFYTLSSGHKMPLVGLGTNFINDSDIIAKAIVDIGYRTIDTAKWYKNETFVGEGIKKAIDSGKVKREDIFVITKLWTDDAEDVEGAIRTSLKKLQLDYVDLYLVHMPIFTKIVEEAKDGKPEKYEKVKIPVHKVWPQMEALVEKGLTRSIGVSNFSLQALWDLTSYCKIPPVCNEIEIHPLFSNDCLVKYCLDQNILPIAYTPLARGEETQRKSGTVNLIDTDLLKDLGKKCQRTPAQIALNWGVNRGYAIIPKSSSFERQKENFYIWDFKLDQEDYEKISALNQKQRLVHSANWSLWYDIFA